MLKMKRSISYGSISIDTVAQLHFPPSLLHEALIPAAPTALDALDLPS